MNIRVPEARIKHDSTAFEVYIVSEHRAVLHWHGARCGVGCEHGECLAWHVFTFFFIARLPLKLTVCPSLHARIAFCVDSIVTLRFWNLWNVVSRQLTYSLAVVMDGDKSCSCNRVQKKANPGDNNAKGAAHQHTYRSIPAMHLTIEHADWQQPKARELQGTYAFTALVQLAWVHDRQHTLTRISSQLTPVSLESPVKTSRWSESGSALSK